ncbi:hypothetical protein PCANC_21121 [Puccinia coronata f. sp. avenae]|uniref:Transmembrane protein n=1 Tax=Puccinia coronata f. sp. avenae TaxID=200324 RepID=A0A2N5SBA3_9BASI|nr:hypothetical protein PCANC_21121 [Puccinia coronata f. sp. avenae]
MSSSQAATPTTTTAPANQSGLTKSVGSEAPVFVQSDLPSRPVLAAALPTPTPAPQVHKTLSLEVNPLVSTSVITIKTTSIRSIALYPASNQHMSADIATAYNTSTDSLPSAESSQHGPAGGFVIPQPIKYIIIAGVGLAVFLAGLTIWSCIQKRNRHRSRKLSFSMSPMSEKEWGTTREPAGGLPNVYRHSVVTYDAKNHSKVMYENFDFGLMVTSQLPTPEEMNQRKMDTISITVHGQHACPAGPHAEPAVLTPFVGVRTACGMRGRACGAPLKNIDVFVEDYGMLDHMVISRLTALFTDTAKNWYIGIRDVHGKKAQPFALVKMSPAEASNELQKIVERNFDRRSEHSESFDSDSLSGLDDTPIQSNPEHFPVLMGSFPAARKLSSSFLPRANNSLPQDIALLPLPRYNFKQNSS